MLYWLSVQCCKLQMLLFSFWNTFKICAGFVQLHLICWGVSNTQESMLHWVSVQCCKLLLLLFSFWNIFEMCRICLHNLLMTQESMLYRVSVQCWKYFLGGKFWVVFFFMICVGSVYIICWWPKKVCCTESVCNVASEWSSFRGEEPLM